MYCVQPCTLLALLTATAIAAICGAYRMLTQPFAITLGLLLGGAEDSRVL